MQSFTISALSRRFSHKFSSSFKDVFGRKVFAGGQRSVGEVASDSSTCNRHAVHGLNDLCRCTHFSRRQLQSLYRLFKQECPKGIINEEKLKTIYSRFFPYGDCTRYVRYVFRSLDEDHDNILHFEDLVMSLSMLSGDCATDKLDWTFRLYDIKHDGVITRDELFDVVTSIYDLAGNFVEPQPQLNAVQQHADAVFQRLDVDSDGVISYDDFMHSCLADDDIMTSLTTFTSSL